MRSRGNGLEFHRPTTPTSVSFEPSNRVSPSERHKGLVEHVAAAKTTTGMLTRLEVL